MSLGDSGEYQLAIDLDISVDLENETEETMINGLLSSIITSIEELNGETLLNYTVDSMDGLYYHVDGYMLDIQSFIMHRLGFIFGGDPPPAGFGSEDPFELPPLNWYYFPLGDSMNSWAHRDFAINLFDAYRYENLTEFYEVFEGHHYWDDYLQQEVFDPLQCNDTYSMPFGTMPGIEHVYIFEKSDWDTYWNEYTPLMDSLDTLVYLGLDVYSGPVEYLEIHPEYWNGTDWVEEEWSYTEAWIQSPTEIFMNDVDYVAVFQISEFAGLDYTSYLSKQNPLMQLFGGKNDGDNGDYAGMGAQDDYEQGPNLFGIPIPHYGEFIPMPMRTPDWNAIGGALTFLEAYIDQIAAVITNPDFITFLESMNEFPDEGDGVAINTFNFDLDKIQNATHFGAEAFMDVDVQQWDNNTGNETMDEMHIDYSLSAEYLWDIGGAFSTVGMTFDLTFTYSSISYHEEPTTTTEPTTTDPELTPGFELLLVFSGLIAIPIISKKRRR